MAGSEIRVNRTKGHQWKAARAVVAIAVAFTSMALHPAIAEQQKSNKKSRSVRLEVGDDFQKIVNSHPEGTRFVIASGLHRLESVQPKDGMVFTGESGAVLSGAKVLKSFSKEGGTWVVTGQTQKGTRHSCTYPCVDPGYERDNFPEDLFIDGKRLHHVASKSQVDPGKWFFDYDADKIYIGDDPSGKQVETSVTAYAFHGTASGVVIDNLTVVRYATPTATGAIHGRDGRGWSVKRVDASHNHAGGIRLGPGMVVRNSRAAHNGQLGIGGGTSGDAATVKDSEIANNGELGYNLGWEAGGLKTADGEGTVVTNNWVHHNRGVGIWFDVYARRSTIASNLVEHNSRRGIFYEISYGPTEIRWNTVRHNGKGQAGSLGSGILIHNSRDVEVFGNAVDSNERGILLTMRDQHKGPDGKLELTNVKVIDNDIRMFTGTTGLVDETDNDAYYTSKGNVFENNTYRLDEKSSKRFAWTGRWSAHDWNQWKRFKNDGDGSLRGSTSAPSLAAKGFKRKSYGPGKGETKKNKDKKDKKKKKKPPASEPTPPVSEPPSPPVPDPTSPPVIKVRTTSTNYYLRRNSCAEGDSYLSTRDEPDVGNACPDFKAGIPNQLMDATGEGSGAQAWPTENGLPFVLDARKEIKARITVRAAKVTSETPALPSAGQAILDAQIKGITENKEVVIGSASVEYTVSPDRESYTIDLTIHPKAELHDKRFEAMVLLTEIRGTVLLHGSYELDDPSSFIKVPQLVYEAA